MLEPLDSSLPHAQPQPVLFYHASFIFKLALCFRGKKALGYLAVEGERPIHYLDHDYRIRFDQSLANNFRGRKYTLEGSCV